MGANVTLFSKQHRDTRGSKSLREVYHPWYKTPYEWVFTLTKNRGLTAHLSRHCHTVVIPLPICLILHEGYSAIF
jgi:hypothetical protein